ncbi:hypothetical protein EYZ11_008287 [Aspergillus tanneri]|uniref:Uncharacterized protein n=1 Tax=Aspergillus tanneri TaxID=1220188 RepID=A0A4S3JBA2_9EURO|nr:uncharacterized protein ATNIH1004_003445 [Aspergillus tanneri]KAA8650756.1 hypothetical protein ATNIH1004_003445 [Aspergillus tanneri]THC92255.1 hypothetical protein EYZ11_008287 [Aspergillus tanneri]
MAQAFSSVLDSAFSLDSEVDHLSQTIDEKRLQMVKQNRELEELQAKIREAEERLKARQSVAMDGSRSRTNTVHKNPGYHSGSTSSATSPTDTAGQYSSGDEQQLRDHRSSS